jgi:hypothetical protein
MFGKEAPLEAQNGHLSDHPVSTFKIDLLFSNASYSFQHLQIIQSLNEVFNKKKS